jgi:hypothetical protein
LRVYVIGRTYRATEIDAGEAAGKFLAWLADDANKALTDLIGTWLWQPPDAGGLGVLAESQWEIAVLRAEIAATWQRGQAHGEAGR